MNNQKLEDTYESIIYYLVLIQICQNGIIRIKVRQTGGSGWQYLIQELSAHFKDFLKGK